MKEAVTSIKVNETLDELNPGGLQIIQARDGYRFSLDPFLLCAFVRTRPESRFADLGTGSGVIPILLISQKKASQVKGVELQPDMADRARRSIALNGMQGQVKIIHGDIRHLPVEMPMGGFDAVVCNPPYRSVTSGKIAPNNERALARHEKEGSLTDFLQASTLLLRSKGRMYMVYLAERIVELLIEMRNVKIEPKRLQIVHPRKGEAANLVLVEGRKHGKPGLTVESPLVIYQGLGRDYTPEILTIYK